MHISIYEDTIILMNKLYMQNYPIVLKDFPSYYLGNPKILSHNKFYLN